MIVSQKRLVRVDNDRVIVDPVKFSFHLYFDHHAKLDCRVPYRMVVGIEGSQQILGSATPTFMWGVVNPLETCSRTDRVLLEFCKDHIVLKN